MKESRIEHVLLEIRCTNACNMVELVMLAYQLVKMHRLAMWLVRTRRDARIDFFVKVCQLLLQVLRMRCYLHPGGVVAREAIQSFGMTENRLGL